MRTVLSRYAAICCMLIVTCVASVGQTTNSYLAPGLPPSTSIVALLKREAWGAAAREIPATVIDKGILKYVPYSSFKVDDYEMNVYGDPDAPAGVEIGIYRKLLDSPIARSNCINFIAAVLRSKKQQVILRSLDPVKDSATTGGSTIEITAPTDEDAYGGWWVSVYYTNSLETSRATEEEMEQISSPKEDAAKHAGWSQSEMPQARQIAATELVVSDAITVDLQDGRKARLVKSNPAEVTIYHSGGVATVPYERLNQSLQTRLGFSATDAALYRDGLRNRQVAYAAQQRRLEDERQEQRRLAALRAEEERLARLARREAARYAPTQLSVQTQAPDLSAYQAPLSYGGRVYVKSYHRKDGTYVSGYSRRK